MAGARLTTRGQVVVYSLLATLAAGLFSLHLTSLDLTVGKWEAFTNGMFGGLCAGFTMVFSLKAYRALTKGK